MQMAPLAVFSILDAEIMVMHCVSGSQWYAARESIGAGTREIPRRNKMQGQLERFTSESENLHLLISSTGDACTAKALA